MRVFSLGLVECHVHKWQIKPGEKAKIYSIIFKRLYHFRDPTKEAYCENNKLTFTDIKCLSVTKWHDAIVLMSTVKCTRTEMEQVSSLGR